MKHADEEQLNETQRPQIMVSNHTSGERLICDGRDGTVRFQFGPDAIVVEVQELLNGKARLRLTTRRGLTLLIAACGHSEFTIEIAK